MIIHTASGLSQLALVVGGGPDVLDVIEPMLPGSRWIIEFVDSADEPYGTVLAMRPDLIVVNLGFDQRSGFSLLSMLRLDPRTRCIPVLSYVCDDEKAPRHEALLDDSGLLPLTGLLPSRAPRH